MASRKSILTGAVMAHRQAERQRIALQRSQTQIARDAERARNAYIKLQAQVARENERERKAFEKEKARLYTESRIAEVALQNEKLEQEITQLNALLHSTLLIDDFLDLETLKKKPVVPPFDPGPLGIALIKPSIDAYLPPALTGMNKHLPWAKKEYDKAYNMAKRRYEEALLSHNQKVEAREQQLAVAKENHRRQAVKIQEETDTHNSQIDQFKRDLGSGIPSAIVNYFMLVLETSWYPEGFPQHAKVAYVPESKQLVVEYDLPTMDVVPEVGSYKYIKAKDEISTTPRPTTQRKTLYSSVIAQVAIRTLHELFEADRFGYLETIVFNGYVDTIDRGTGKPMRPCLITVRTSKDTFNGLDLSKVDPIACLKVLNAEVSKKPEELAAVRPVLEFNMVDPRFIEETDVISGLDQRPNLMELTPSEFEALISNLFQKMGLETRLTQASRDGGVDCVAYDPRPIFGGKVIIQAKRYKHTVGVSAVRDLYGTLQNEGASKGILVTTSGYGKAAFEFAQGKPLELLAGSNLLYLLAEHAGIEAKIVPPENWKDPQVDSQSDEEIYEPKR